MNAGDKDEDIMVRLYKGNMAAVELAKQVAFLADVWDNLYDGDKQVTRAELNRAFWVALFEIPSNPVYREAEAYLRPALVSGYLAWMNANYLETRKDDHHALTVSHVARYGLSEALVMIAFVVGGRDWAEVVGPDIRMMCQRDKLDDYLKEKGYAPPETLGSKSRAKAR